MSFLDNAGSIILDAILTDIGRKRMAQGKFKVSKFALGDDEIDYKLYLHEVNDPDSDPTDPIILPYNSQNRILSQSIFEALAQNNAVINYGLVSYNRPDLMYIPVLRANNKLSGAARPAKDTQLYDGVDSDNVSLPIPNTSGSSGYYYFSVNDETTKKLKSLYKEEESVLENNRVDGTKIIIESGIASDIASTSEMRDSYILQAGLFDNNFNIYCDSRFFNGVLSPVQKITFKNKITGKVIVNFGLLNKQPPTSLAQIVDKFEGYIAKGGSNLIVNHGSNGTDDKEISACEGPRGSVTALNFSLKNELLGDSAAARDQKYSIFGKTDQYLNGDDKNKYDYIDTSIYIEGLASNGRLQLPLRIIRCASASAGT
jgi:hypothetical protein